MASTASTIQRTLNLIVPTANTLPPSLIDHATTLLAQSRAKVPTLRPDEEIARPFACCHIACERLKNRLALEIGKVGPPCGPRIYKRLYAFLDSTLAADPSTPRTKRVQDVEATPASGRSGRLAAVGASGGLKTTPGSLGKRNRGTVVQDDATANLPRSTMPLIKHVCEGSLTPRMATHVYAGVESVFRLLQRAQDSEPGTPSKRRRSNNGDTEATVLAVPTEEQVPALVAVVYLMAAGSPPNSSEFVTDEEQRQKVQAAVESYFAKRKTASTIIDPEALSRDIEIYCRAAAQGWTDMEWYQNLPNKTNANTGTEGGNEDDEPVTPRKRPAKTPLRRKEKHSQRKIGDDDHGPAGLLPGLGTMFQPAVDWLSEDRTADFAVWKQDVLRSVASIEQRG